MTEQFDNVPHELTQREQWLYWNASADKPRKPLASPAANRGCSWSDPDVWMPFEEVVDGAETVDQAGIGYVNAADNDDYARGLYGLIDLDGCVDEEGRPKDWLPSLQPFFDRNAYMEFSPSMEEDDNDDDPGIHIPVAGFEPPEWWADQHFSDDEHEGVEVLTNKFSTFTGNKLQNAGDDVVDYGDWLNEWLLEAFKAVTGEDPLEESHTADLDPDEAPASSSAGQPGDRDEWLTEEIAKEALSHVDPDAAYGTWRDIGMALANHFGTSAGKRLFVSWSRGGTKWDSEAKKQAERIVKDASNYNYDIGTVVYYADQNGWDASQAAREAMSGRESRDDDSDDEQEGDATEQPEPPTEPDSDDASDLWAHTRDLYRLDDEQDENYKGKARLTATDALEADDSFMYVVESELLWVFDDDRGIFVGGGEDYIHNLIEDELGEYYSISERNEITDRIRARNQTERSELNAKEADDPLLCVGNGVVNLQSGELLDHDPTFKFTRGLEWDYDPDADRSRIVEFLSGITKREADWKTLIDHLAHGLMPGYPYRAFVITYGPGGNGKTQLGELFRGFVGEDNAAAVELQDLTGDDDFATGPLPSSFINVGDDVSVGEIRNTSTLKTATGGGTLRANEKHVKRFEFRNEAAMFFSANEPPRIKEDKQSIADRLYPIHMPFRHVDDPDPDNPYERQKIPGISEDLLADEEAMRGLLALAVEHAQRLIETNGSYSMPEGPDERRAMYEAASDPIQRFALEQLEEGDGSDVILKDDAYTVYTNLCDRDDERPARDDTFKGKISQQPIVDVESGQTRQLTPGDDRQHCWKYVRFSEEAKELMPRRLVDRYFPATGETDDDDDGGTPDEQQDDDRAAFAAEPIKSAAEALTGYVTVTAEIVTTHRLGETESGVKAVVKDESGAIDLVTWDQEMGEQLEDLEGECVAVQNAEVDEYDGTHQLTTVESLTALTPIQQGVGYTADAEINGGAEDDAGTQAVQSGLADAADETEASTDGGQSVIAAIDETIRTAEAGEMLTVAAVAGETGIAPDTTRQRLETLATEKGLLVDHGDDEFEVL